MFYVKKNLELLDLVIDERQERGEDEEHFGLSLQNCRKLVA